MNAKPMKHSLKRKRKKRTDNDIDNGYFPESPDINQPCESIYSTESLINRFPMVEHLVNYNEILEKLVERKAHSLSPRSNNSSYEEWRKAQHDLAVSRAATKSLEDVLKSRIEMTTDKFVKTRKWETMDVINYLTSGRPQRNESFTSTSSRKTNKTTTETQNPIVLMVVKDRKHTKAGLSDSSKPGGTGKPKSKKGKSPKSKSGRSKSSVKTATSSHDTLLKEPVFPHKYKPTYKLSNFDYLKKGWTKLPDYSITYRCVTLGAEPAFPELWAFRKRTDGKIDYYPNTTKEAGNFDGEMPYFIYYPNGEIAVSINDGRIGPRLIVYSMSKKDESGRMIDSRPQAMFDTKGNGVVWDLDGKMKMNYDQIEGALYPSHDRARPVLHWYWKESTYLRMRRADLEGLAPDHNDDVDPNRPDRERSRSRTGTSKKSSKKSGKSSKKGGKGKRKSKAPGGRKSMARKSKTGARKSKTGARKSKTGARKSKTGARKSRSGGMKRTGRQSKTPGKSRKSKVGSGKRKSRVGKKGGKNKGKGYSKKLTRSDVPPLRKKPSRPKPITEVAPIPVKITDYVSMRILSQQHIHLDYECGSVHYRMYLGVNIKPQLVERIDKVVQPRKVSNITPCYFELMPLRSMSLYNVNQRLKDMRQDAARRAFKRSVRTITGFYSWWHKKTMVKFHKGVPRSPLGEKSAMRVASEKKIKL